MKDKKSGDAMPTIHLREVTEENFDAVVALKVKDGQRVAPNVYSLAQAYVSRHAWTRAIYLDDCPVRIGFQKNVDYAPPVWPEKPGEQQQMVHIDFNVKDKEEMMERVRHALACGARKAEEQYSDRWTVMFDPEGHPFCIDT
jgi:hypothetical protein